MGYASFWKRTAAYLLDAFIYGIGAWIISFIIERLGGAIFASGNPSLPQALVVGLIVLLVRIACYIFYFAWPESTPWQATVGKKLFGLKVTDLNGQRISFLRAIGRNVGMILSGLILCIGYLMCLWTEKRQCLHDQMSDCLVMDTTPNEKKVATVVVIVLYILFFFTVVGIVTAIAVPQYKKSYNEAYGAMMERMRFSQAQLTLHDMNDAREIAEASSKTPVTRWDQLDGFDCTVQSNPSICESEDFTYEMKKDSVSAKRTLENGNYILSVNRQGNVSCFGDGKDGSEMCKQVLP